LNAGSQRDDTADSAARSANALAIPERRVSAAESDRVQTLRGVACILLVAYHVIGDGLTRGLGVDDTSHYRTFSNIFLHLRMPLFTFLSGFVYAYRPVLAGSSGTFARKKLQRLLIPLLVVSTLYFIVQRLVPDTNTKQPWDTIWRIYVFPYNHFWFLQAITLIFAATLMLEMRGWLQSSGRYLAILAVVLAIHFTAAPEPNVFSIKQATYLVPFFLAGLGANRFHALFWDRRLQFAMLAIFLVTFSLHVLGCLHVYGAPLEQRTLLATALSLSGILTLMYWTPPYAVLGWLGGFSFTIYLYHVFFTAGARIALHKLGVHDVNLHVLLGCALGVLGPVFFELSVRRSGLARRLLLGQS
jgi:peptidoglycan/LPS O-acetylase OafA/YrhL